MKARKRRVVAGFFLLGLCVMVVLAVVARVFQFRELQRQQAVERSDFSPRELVWAEVKERDLSRERRLLVRLEPWRDAGLAAEIGGVVSEVSAEPGQVVAAGDVLVRLDDAVLRAEFAAAEVELAEAERLVAEARRLAGGGVVGESELAARSAARDGAAARRELIRARVGQAVVRAPFDGVVRVRRVEQGEAVAPGQVLVELVDKERLRGVMDVAESELAAFSAGGKLTVRVPGLGGREFVGEVRNVASAADGATRLFRVEMEVPMPEGGGVPAGLVGETFVVLSVWSGVPSIPEAAVRWVGNMAVVEVLDGGGESGGVREVEVELGPLVRGFFPVLRGVKAGERVILR